MKRGRSARERAEGVRFAVRIPMDSDASSFPPPGSTEGRSRHASLNTCRTRGCLKGSSIPADRKLPYTAEARAKRNGHREDCAVGEVLSRYPI